MGSWLWARTWFTGPRRQIVLESAGVNTSDPVAVAKAEEKGLAALETEKKLV
jgi:hypothetical protein